MGNLILNSLEICSYSALNSMKPKQATGAQKITLQNATELQHIFDVSVTIDAKVAIFEMSKTKL